tara:strand:+ start:3068 stop:3850 length:783 start_codon:yes stop_codon:yes gene_type:complete
MSVDFHNLSDRELADLISDHLTQTIDDKFLQSCPSNYEEAKEAIGNAVKVLDLDEYSRTRNHVDGSVSELSSYIRHGLVSTGEVYEATRSKEGSQKFTQELCWREYFSTYAERNPYSLWQSIESYKTGFDETDYANSLPVDILEHNTGEICIDQMIRELYATGHLHNHCRMYLASYVVHFRRVKWQVGASWFLEHLVDGDVASNNLSWQWVASTFSAKPYIFNLDNVKKYCATRYDVSPVHNINLNYSYEDLAARLFPNV